jgi:hypothetical protein
MFYNLATRLPGIQLMRAPERFNMFLALPISALAAYGLARLLPGLKAARNPGPPERLVTVGRPARKRTAVASLMALIVAAIGFEYLVIIVRLLTDAQSIFVNHQEREVRHERSTSL